MLLQALVGTFKFNSELKPPHWSSMLRTKFLYIFFRVSTLKDAYVGFNSGAPEQNFAGLSSSGLDFRLQTLREVCNNFLRGCTKTLIMGIYP
jgi:hypothetical protein